MSAATTLKFKKKPVSSNGVSIKVFGGSHYVKSDNENIPVKQVFSDICKIRVLLI